MTETTTRPAPDTTPATKPAASQRDGGGRAEATPAAAKVTARGVDVFYGDTHAIKDVNVDIQDRTVTAFIGPSGCGKTTFLRSINRMHEVLPGATVDGQLLLDGEDIYGPGVDPVRVRSQIGMVFQRPNPFPTMSIRDNVLAGYKLNGTRLNKSRADELVEKSPGVVDER